MRLRLVIARLGLVDVGEIADEQRDILTGRGLRLRRDGERLLVELLRLAGIGLQQVDRGQVGEGLRQSLIVRRQILLQRAEHLFEHRRCLGVPAQRLVGAGQVVQRRDVGEIVGAAALGRRLGFLSLREGGRIVPGSIEILKPLLRRGDVDLLRLGLQRRRCHRNDRQNQEGDQRAPPSRSHDCSNGRNYRPADFIRIGSLKLIPVRRENSLVCFAEELACKRLSLLDGRLVRGLNGSGPSVFPGLTITKPSNYIIFRAAAKFSLLLGTRQARGRVRNGRW